MSEQVLGFIGAGQMARALARGLVARQLFPASRIIACDPDLSARQQFLADIAGAQGVSDNRAVVRQSDVIVVAVKPQSLRLVSHELAGADSQGKLFISILAGVSLAALTNALGASRVVRVMPNTPCLVGQGASAYALAEGATAADAQLVEKLFGAVGITHRLPEKLLDAVTGLSGSGPAYVYLLIEALSDGGVRMGLPRSVAVSLAAQTVLGAAQLVLSTKEHPAELKDRVASPAGTTIAGLQVLERRAVRSAFIDAVEAATLRSRELGAPESGSQS